MRIIGFVIEKINGPKREVEMKKRGVLFFLLLPIISISSAVPSFSPRSAASWPRYTAIEIKPDTNDIDSLYFSRPVAVVYDKNSLFVLDSEDEDIRVFSKSGALLYSFGRKGQGPGEFQMPGDIDILGDRVYVADGANRRVQILDKKGKYLAGFNTPFWPQRILALDPERIVLGHIPSGLSGKEKVLHCYNSKGKLQWESMDSYFSGDSVYDLMRNRIFLKKGNGGDFFFVRSSDDRIIRRISKDGALLSEIEVTRAYAVKEIDIPSRGGQKKKLAGFCWNCAVDGGKFYLLIPQLTAAKDLVPGKQAAVIDGAGKIEAFIDFPFTMTRMAVEGERVYGLDTEARLRFFAIKK
jgi:hypothetical protein